MPLPIDPNNFDAAADPVNDFFQFVNGGWLAKNPIPADESRWGSFDILRFDVERQLQTLLDEIEKKNDLVAGSDAQKVRDFYRTAVDVEKRNRLGVSPLSQIFKKIDDISDLESLAFVVGHLHRIGAGAFWSPFVEQDEKKSTVMALHLYQGGLGLPDRDYYLDESEKNKKIRADYITYINDMLGRAGLASGPKQADIIMKIETRLATASLTRVELRDVEKMYNKYPLAELTVLTGKVTWQKYFEGAVFPMPEYAVVGQPNFFETAGRVFSETSLDDLKVYLKWCALNGMANYLSEEFERRSFDFYDRTFNGATEMKPLWRRALRATDAALDELLGKLYVERHFSEDAKQKIKDLVEHLAVAYRARIEKLDWMSTETKKKALEKLDTVNKKLGYPDVWKDFSGLAVESDSYAENAMRAYAFEFNRKMKEIGGLVDRNEWLMSPQTVNAYYMPPMNDIVFPAAILQPPFFDPKADDAVNFGGIGSVIGHEFTHGFDDQGSRFDAQGNLHEWWSKEDKKQFDTKAAGLAQQFDVYEPLPGVHINGKLTLGENIADLGGLLVAYDAMKLKLAEKSPEERLAAEKIDGFTPEQRFFIGFAITERGQSREELLRLRLQTDPHSPSKFRVNGPLSNMTEFYEAFGVKQGDELWRDPEKRVKIW